MSRLLIHHDRCTLCELCVPACPYEALLVEEGRLRVTEECVLCGACVKSCPEDALCILQEREPAPVDLSAYRGVWVVAELQWGEIHPVTLQLLSKGRELADARDAPLCAVVLGNDVGKAVEELRRYPVERILVADEPGLARFSSETYAKVVAELIEGERPEIVLCGATSAGRAFFPRVAALLKTGLTADCTALEIDEQEGHLNQTRPAFGGNIMATIVCPRHRPQMATVRPNVLPQPEPLETPEAEVRHFSPSPSALESRAEVLEVCLEESGAVNLGEADIIVAGGRGVGSAEGFEAIRALARELGGAVGASRAAVDAGWIAYPHQVGQTGKTVQPRLYVACGISGAVQHRVGMQSAEKVIAINRDRDAPIFRVADIGLVGDLQVIVPSLTQSIRRGREQPKR